MIILHLQHSKFTTTPSVTLTLIHELQKLGNTVIYVDLYDLKKSITPKKRGTGPRKDLDFFNLQLLSNLRQLLIKNNVDILHCHDTESNFFGLAAAIGLKIKRITTIHFHPKKNQFTARVYEFINGILLNFFNAGVAASDLLAAEMKPFCCRKDKITAIYNGIDLTTLSPDNNEQKNIGIPRGHRAIACILTQPSAPIVKNVMTAFQDILTEHPLTTLLITTDNASQKDLTEFAPQTKNMIFLEWPADRQELYQAVDIFLFPCPEKHIPVIFLEAFAVKKPVIAINNGETGKILRNNINGLLIPAEHPAAIRQSIHLLLTNSELAQKLGEEGRKMVETQFTASIMAVEYQKIYDLIIKY